MNSDTPDLDEALMHTARLVAHICDTAVGLVRDETRQAAHGLSAQRAGDLASFAADLALSHADAGGVYTSLDAQGDARAAELGFRFVAGITVNGVQLCAAHPELRETLSEEVQQALGDLAALTAAHHQQTELKDELTSLREQLELAQLRLEQGSLHDTLTGLPNRQLFDEHLWTAISRLERHPNGGYAVFLLNFDDFKRINATYAYAVGDELLVAIADRLRRLLRPSDVVARLAGDEFMVLLSDVQGEHAVMQAAERTVQAFNEPLELSDQNVMVTVSVGVVIGAAHLRRPRDVLQGAGAALHRAKVEGRARYAVFRPEAS